jgi:transcriptional regulator with XRE-family HTH domain
MESTFGQYIRSRREELDLSLREFARKIKRSAAFVSDIELGRRYPSEDVLPDIARVLDVSIQTLKTYDNRPPIEDVKKAVEQNPGYAFAFRKVIGAGVKPEALNKLADQTVKKRNK